MMIKNIQTWNGKSIDITLLGGQYESMDTKDLVAFPAIVDPHVHFRTPGMEYKEDWRFASKAAIRGGCTTVFDMPNTIPPTITHQLLQDKKALIDRQLEEVGIPLRYQLFFGADKNHFDEIALIKNQAVGIKVFMGCSTGNLVIDDDESLDRIFAIAARENMIIAVHAEDEELINQRKPAFVDRKDHPAHTEIRNVEVATRAVKKAIDLVRKHRTRLYILHVSTAAEIDLIRSAKSEGLPVYAETTPHHLFFSADDYDRLEGKGVVNPPLRHKHDKGDIFAAINEGVIDTIGSDHAPHTLEEKSQAYGQCPSGMPGIEFVLSMLLTAWHKGQISLENIVDITSKNARKIFNLQVEQDWVLVDLNKQFTVESTQSKCGWTPYYGLRLQGWPVYTIMRGYCYYNQQDILDQAKCS